MSNNFADKPELEAGFPSYKKVWTCPVTGIKVPKEPLANLKWRTKILDMCEEDLDFRQDIYTACAKSFLFFCNAFGFTRRVFEPDKDTGAVKQSEHKDVPFITWENIQDEHLLWIEKKAEEGGEGLTDKSRDMGATWNHMFLLTHRFLFKKDEALLVISRKEDALDQLSGMPSKNYPFGRLANVGTLFGKVDYILSRLPAWMVPQCARKRMHLVNLDNGTHIDGETTGESAASGDRVNVIFLDEMAKMPNAEEIKRSTRDVTACRLVCSTPNGAGTTYSKWRMSGQIDVFILPWWEHPEKGLNRYAEQDDLGRWKIRSPWYNIEEKERSTKELAIEVDMDHLGSGDLFFDNTTLEQHKLLYGKKPKTTRTIDWAKDVPDVDIPGLTVRRDRSKLKVVNNGPLSIWVSLVKGRPEQNKTYILGIDISKGMGASNSVISVFCKETGVKVAEWADANTPAHALARIATAIAVWFGGKTKHPLVIWENNGDPGFDFGNQFVSIYNYPNIYFQRQEGTVAKKRGKRYGWRSSPEEKAAALGLLRRAYDHGGFVNHSEAAINETMTYIYYENGGVGPALLMEESASARKTHGDRTIADALCLVGLEGRVVGKTKSPEAPRRSFGYRLKQFQRKQRNKARGLGPRKMEKFNAY